MVPNEFVPKQGLERLGSERKGRGSAREREEAVGLY